MKNSTMKSKIIWGVVTIAALFLCYLLSRYVFFGLHGMKEWPFNLFVFGAAVIAVAAFANSRMVMVFTVAGYIFGFAAGMLLNTDGADAGGGTLNNAWVIWTATFLCFICIGIIGDVLSKRRRKKQEG
jgi:hypothetical protein